MGEYVRLPEMEKEDVGRIRWDVNLPDYAHADMIVANARLLNWVGVAAGFDSLRIGSFAGGTDRVIPQVNPYAGMSGELGEATAAGRTHRKRAKRHQSEGSDPSRENKLWQRSAPFGQEIMEVMTPSYSHGTLTVNTDVIAQNLSSSRELQKPEAWARELNSSIAVASRNAARRNLLTPYGLAGFAVAEAIAIQPSLIFRHYPEYFPAALAVANAGVALVAYTAGSIAFRPKDFLQTRWSLVFGAQLDRLAFVYGATATKCLVKSL